LHINIFPGAGTKQDIFLSRKHEKENLISHFLLFSTGRNHFCLSACLPVCRAGGTGRLRRAAQAGTNFTIKGLNEFHKVNKLLFQNGNVINSPIHIHLMRQSRKV